MHSLILLAAFVVGAPESISVRDACGEDATVVANVQETDPIQVRHGMVGESTPCYAVSVTLAGTEIKGYIRSASLPAIEEFERRRALESRVPLPPVPESPATAKKTELAAPAPVGPPFEPWSGVDTNGARVQIAPANARVTLVTFWSPPSGAARRYVERLEATGAEFRGRGIRSFGLMVGVDAKRANEYMEDMGLMAPQALDRQRLGAKYNVDAAKGTTLVIDSSNNVVAITSNPAEIRDVVTRLLSLK